MKVNFSSALNILPLVFGYHLLDQILTSGVRNVFLIPGTLNPSLCPSYFYFP